LSLIDTLPGLAILTATTFPWFAMHFRTVALFTGLKSRGRLP
jgi:hypothetical protein